MQVLARTAALVAATALTAGLAAAPAQAATKRADLGADWLAGELTGGLVHNSQYDFDDYGLTADTGLALAAVGGHDRALDTVRRALARHVDSYTTGVDFGSSDVYAGATAKLAVLARESGDQPRDFGGVNLVKRLKGLVSTTAPTRGRISDDADADYSNVLGQSFAVQALAPVGGKKARWTKSFLLKQQCDAGFFRLGFAPADAKAQGCDAARKADRAPDTDATAIAVIALASLDKPGPKGKAAIKDAVRWLKRQQGAKGAFGGGTSTEAPNTNSTGLAAWAFGVTGTCTRADRAATWVKKRQVAGVEKGALRRDNGAIAYDSAALDAAGSAGIVTEAEDQWRRASAQAAPGLLFLDGTCGRG